MAEAYKGALVALWAGLALVGEPVQAQTPLIDSEEAETQSEDRQPNVQQRARLDEIVVSAQRREENLQDIPVVVSVFSGEDLVNANISESHGLQLKTPGMVYNSQGGYAHIYIRGIGSDGTIPSSEGSIATFLDGVYNPNANSAIQHFADVERVEVLKGPQGTLFGRNTTGGAINITTRKPSDELAMEFAGYGGSFSRRGADLFASGPIISDWLKVSVSGYYDESEHYYISINPNSPEVIGVEDWGARVKVLAQITDQIEAMVTGYITYHVGPDTTVANNLRTSLLTQLGGGQTEGNNIPYKTNADRGPYFNKYKNTAVDLNLTYANDWFELRSITAYLDTDNSGFIELDYTDADLEEVPVPRAFTNTKTQELQISSLWDSALQYVAGAYYLESEGGFDPLEIAVGPRATPNQGLDTLLGALGPTGLDSVISSLFPTFPAAVTLRTYGIIETKAYAAYGNASYELWDQLTFRVGLRYSRETRYLVESRTEVRPLGLPLSPEVLTADPDERTWKAWTPMASIEWKPDNVLYYLKWAEGFKSGNWNPVLILEPLIPVEPEEITSFEGGIKGEFFDSMLRLNMSAFWYDYQDLQVQVVSIVSSGTARLENAGNARVYGGEMQMALVPFEGLLANLGVSWLQSEYLEYFGTGFDEDTGLAYEGDFSGNELNRAPEWTLSADATYSFDIWGGTADLSASYYFASGWYFDAQNTVQQKAFSVIGARVSYLHERSNLRLSVIGSNLTNTEYLMNALLHDFGVHGTYAPPRKILFRLDWML